MIERDHRGRARVEDHIRNDKDTGMRNLPFRDFEHNQVWLAVVALAHDLIVWTERLLLGLKGQMSEAELHMITSRLHGAKRAAAERGELRFPLPVGYVHDDEGQTIIDPDEEVRAAIADLFGAFEQTGSAYGVVGAFKDRRFPKRAYGGAWAGELRRGALTHPRALGVLSGVLSNPCYAGAYVFGRYRSHRGVRPDGTIFNKVVELPRAEWAVLIKAHHPGYITWETYLANEQRLRANDTHSGQRPPREGRALCQGIVRCGACGGSITTLHRREGSYYECGHSRADHINTPACRSVKTVVVDELVARRLLDAIPAQYRSLAGLAAPAVRSHDHVAVTRAPAADLSPGRSVVAPDFPEKPPVKLTGRRRTCKSGPVQAPGELCALALAQAAEFGRADGTPTRRPRRSSFTMNRHPAYPIITSTPIAMIAACMTLDAHSPALAATPDT